VSPLKVGEHLPSFALTDEDGQRFDSEELKGRTSVLIFYPFAFSPVCTDQLQLYEREQETFDRLGATLYGISCNAHWSQRAFKEKLGVNIQQLSDFEPKGEVSKLLDVYHSGGFSQRAIIIVDEEGVVSWNYQAESPGELPPVELIIDALSS